MELKWTSFSVNCSEISQIMYNLRTGINIVVAFVNNMILNDQSWCTVMLSAAVMPSCI